MVRASAQLVMEENVNYRIELLEGGQAPRRCTDGAIGYDLYARAIVSAHDSDPCDSRLRLTIWDFSKGPYILSPGSKALVGVGFITELPPDIMMGIYPRSGLASKSGIVVANAPGVVDPDYRGEAGVLLYNISHTTFFIEKGMRIAQAVFHPIVLPNFVTNEQLTPTARDAGGFGSTGV